MTQSAASLNPADPEVRTILRPGDVVTRPDWPADRAVTSVHIVRIGGAGMSAVARLAIEAGLEVSGSDSQDGQFIAPLREAGARIVIGFDAGTLADTTDLVVVSTAVRADNPEVLAARERGIPVIHRAAALEGLLRGRSLLAVAGTHGKTSTTAMAALALRGAGVDPGWALGAAVPDLGRNAGFGSGEDLAVVEADESDGSFLAFAPQVLVVTNLEPDHLDFHGSEENLVAAFDALAARVPDEGAVLVCADDPGALALGDRIAAAGGRVLRYGAAPDADWRILSEQSTTLGATVRLASPQGEADLSLSVTGHHNVLNALGAIAASAQVLPGARLEELCAGLVAFRGASRRFELKGQAGGAAVYDDYAHHPSEVEATVAAARGIVDSEGRGGRVLAVLQPHLYSRTRLFAADFAASLSGADQAWVLPVYGAREDPDPAVTARTITDHVQGGSVLALEDRSVLPAALAAIARPGDVVLLLGAGDIVQDTPAVLAALGAGDAEAP